MDKEVARIIAKLPDQISQPHTRSRDVMRIADCTFVGVSSQALLQQFFSDSESLCYIPVFICTTWQVALFFFLPVCLSQLLPRPRSSRPPRTLTATKGWSLSFQRPGS